MRKKEAALLAAPSMLYKALYKHTIQPSGLSRHAVAISCVQKLSNSTHGAGDRCKLRKGWGSRHCPNTLPLTNRFDVLRNPYLVFNNRFLEGIVTSTRARFGLEVFVSRRCVARSVVASMSPPFEMSVRRIVND